MSAADATSEAVASTPAKVTTDRYGFVISNAGTPGASTSASDNSPVMSKEMTRLKKWQKMLGELRAALHHCNTSKLGSMLSCVPGLRTYHVDSKAIWMGTFCCTLCLARPCDLLIRGRSSLDNTLQGFPLQVQD